MNDDYRSCNVIILIGYETIRIFFEHLAHRLKDTNADTHKYGPLQYSVKISSLLRVPDLGDLATYH
jgi:hypothetical protein